MIECPCHINKTACHKNDENVTSISEITFSNICGFKFSLARCLWLLIRFRVWINAPELQTMTLCRESGDYFIVVIVIVGLNLCTCPRRKVAFHVANCVKVNMCY